MINNILRIRESIESTHDPTYPIYDEHFVDDSPCGKYRLTVDAYGTAEDPTNASVAVATVKRNATGDIIAAIKRNDSRVFYSWISRGGHDYLLLAVHLEGQTVVDLTERRIEGFASEDDPFIWTEFYPSPDKSKLAIIGCYWACPYQVTVYDFRYPMRLPLPKIIQLELPENSATFGEWVSNNSLSVMDERKTVHVFDVP